MAGLYIHIPFCKQACSYCNFHFSTRLGQLDRMLDAIIRELELRSNYLEGRSLESVYFGGGTPSLLTTEQLDRIWLAIRLYFEIDPDAEITLEANPDDLSREKLQAIRSGPVNRLSIGIQSFRNEDLRWMHRAHDARQAIQCLDDTLELGFENFSIDLIYGLPGLSDRDWYKNLEKAAFYQVNHLSSYALTVEPKTLLAHQIRRQQVPGPQDEVMTHHFHLLTEFAAAHGYVHYEISNFAREGHLAIHNTNYWKQKPYLGLGPSAHSYDGWSRSWNIANNARYIRAMEDGIWPGETEVLTTDQRYNEYVMTGLRTQWGCRETDLKQMGEHYLQTFQEGIRLFVQRGWVESFNGTYLLTGEGKLFADFIASELFVV
jgi:oxygen-independent coproporphyrinogen III oxidase